MRIITVIVKDFLELPMLKQLVLVALAYKSKISKDYGLSILDWNFSYMLCSVYLKIIIIFI